MKKSFYWVFLTGLWGCLNMTSAEARQLLFSDEFNSTNIDQTDWLPASRPGPGQGSEKAEGQFYVPDALSESSGCLHITVKKAETIDPQMKVHFSYTSGCLESRRTYLYGRFEFRIRLPKGKGLWPHLLLRTPPKLPLNGEIDVMEGYGSHPNIVRSALHPWLDGVDAQPFAVWLVVKPLPDTQKFHKEGVARIDQLITLPRDLSEDFHIFGVDWQPDHVTWTFDGLPYFTVRDRIPKQPMVVVLQMAMSVHWDGKPDSSTILPQSLDIDYIRVWSTGK